MAKVTIARANGGLPGVRRDRVKPGAVFSHVMRDGKPGKKLFVAIGNNGKFYSLNISNGRCAKLASTGNGHKTVTLVGKANLETTRFGRYDRRDTVRSGVKSGQLFKHYGSDVVYLALGTLRDGRFASINMDDPLNGDYAVGKNPNSNVTVVGDATWNVTLAD